MKYLRLYADRNGENHSDEIEGTVSDGPTVTLSAGDTLRMEDTTGKGIRRK